jgi:hypothetical protein
MAGKYEGLSDKSDSKKKKKTGWQAPEPIPAAKETPKESAPLPEVTEKKKPLLELIVPHDDEEKPKTEQPPTVETTETTPPAADMQAEVAEAASIAPEMAEAAEAPDPLEPLAPEANVEELSDDELQHVAEQIIDARSEELDEELQETPPDDQAKVRANAAFINNLKQASAEQPLDDELIDQVADQTQAEFNLGDTAEAPESDEPHASEESIAEQPDAEAPPFTAEAETPDTDTDPTDPYQQAASGSAAPPPPPPPSGRGTPPPQPPPMPGFGADFAPPPPNFVPPTPNAAPAGPNAQRLSPEQNNRYKRRSDLLVGGIVGYLIGRRRGRINTEARLMPVQKNLERQVTDLREKIMYREAKIRTLVATERTAVQAEAVRPVVPPAETAPDRPTPERPGDASVEAPIAPVIPEVSAAEKPPEQAPDGLIVIPHEETTAPASRYEAAEVAQPSPAETIATMPEVELLAIAATIEVAGQTAKSLYEQGRLTKNELRMVAEEYVKGDRHYEQFLLDKLRPPAESMEFLPTENAGGAQAGGAGGSGGGGDGSTSLFPSTPAANASWQPPLPPTTQNTLPVDIVDAPVGKQSSLPSNAASIVAVSAVAGLVMFIAAQILL